MLRKKDKRFMLTGWLVLLFILTGCAGLDAGEETAKPHQPTATLLEASPPAADTATAEPTETSAPTALPTEEPTPTAAPTDTGEPLVETPQVDQQLTKSEIVAAVKADLASRLGISQDQISVVSAEAVTWNDTSLGCPEKGKMYAQVLTPGYQIVLLAGGAEYDYHADEYGHFVLCE